MKALIFETFGSPQVLRYAEVASVFWNGRRETRAY